MDAARVEITVRRPDGETDIVSGGKITHMTDRVWAMMQDATRKAGRGECISYINIAASETPAQALLAEIRSLTDQATNTADSNPAKSINLSARAMELKREWDANYADNYNTNECPNAGDSTLDTE